MKKSHVILFLLFVLSLSFEKGGTHRGLFILNVSTFEEANQLLEGDTAIKEKYLEAELIQWYGSASLMETPEIHKKIQKSNF
ncbi:MAG: hypothetical protein IPH32_12840 [Bacteroidetes bacterium]|nr:hypothetical protein [Bacteroidota bacterium]